LEATEEYYVGIANGMAGPPLDLKAIDQADVLPAYKAVVTSFRTEAFLGPQELFKNPAVSAVQAKSKPITPGLGEIVQGAFSGDVTDVKAELPNIAPPGTHRLMPSSRRVIWNTDAAQPAPPQGTGPHLASPRRGARRRFRFREERIRRSTDSIDRVQLERLEPSLVRVSSTRTSLVDASSFPRVFPERALEYSQSI
jgi:hypothetical protein